MEVEVDDRFAVETQLVRPPDEGGLQALDVDLIESVGSSINLHIHWHWVVSDGAFALQDGRLSFRPATAPSVEQIERITQTLRWRILTTLLKIRSIPEETAQELLQREHSGFSLNASVRVEAEDRDALRRLLSYCTRPAIAPNRLSYLPERGLVRYRPIKGKDELMGWTPLEFLGRFAPIIPPTP